MEQLLERLEDAVKKGDEAKVRELKRAIRDYPNTMLGESLHDVFLW